MGKLDEKTTVPIGWIAAAVMLILGLLPTYGTFRVVDERTKEIPTILEAVRNQDTRIVILEVKAGLKGETSDMVDTTSSGSTSETKKQVARVVQPGYEFQFSDCHGSPGSLTVKSGSLITFDNRDGEPITISFAGKTVRIPAYGTAVASTMRLGTHQITCNGGGAASLTVVK